MKQTVHIVVDCDNQKNQVLFTIQQGTQCATTKIKYSRFFKIITIWHSAWQLKKLIRPFCTYTLQANGLLEALICKAALNKKYCSKLIIKISSLAAEKYKDSHQLGQKNMPKKIWHTLQHWYLQSLEKKAYTINHTVNTTIETITPALKEYLFNTYAINPDKIKIIQPQTVNPLPLDTRFTWKSTIRSELNIPMDWTVYCYNDDAQSEKCRQEAVFFFKQQLAKNAHIFLLILTNDTKNFNILMQQNNLPNNSYHIKTKQENDILRYACASNKAIVYKPNSLAQWVSCPKEVLEYQAAGLTIIHNNTVELLVKNSNKAIQK